MMMCFNQQRTVVYSYRRDILEGEEQIFDLVRDMIAGCCARCRCISLLHGRTLTREAYR